MEKPQSLSRTEMCQLRRVLTEGTSFLKSWVAPGPNFTSVKLMEPKPLEFVVEIGWY
jgi:hypothetical protein